MRMYPPLRHQNSLGPEQRLIAALLRQDAGAAEQMIQDCLEHQDTITVFCADNVARLVYQRLGQLGLLPAIESLMLADGTHVVEQLQQDMIRQVLACRKLEQLFLELLDTLREFTDGLVWLKGTSLARTLYEDSQDRGSVDFDIAVERTIAQDVLECLTKQGFSPVWNHPGYCHQFGVGPVNSLDDLFLVPHNECEGCHNLTLRKKNWPELELKFNPMDTGLVMKDFDQFFARAERVSWKGRTFLAPHPIDHLMIELVHFHKHWMCGWGWLYDIHLLAKRLSIMPGAWDEFVNRCLEEGINSSAWQGLSLADNLLSTGTPAHVLTLLKPAYAKLWDYELFLHIRTEFVWNCNSLPMLILNSLFMGDYKRKLHVLLGCFIPKDLFLSQYYARGHRITWLNRWIFLTLHWFVLILPSGVIRHTIGPLVWGVHAVTPSGN
jgi:hypothetical protein